MPEKKYSLVRGGPARLEISWRGIWKDFTIRMDGGEVGRFSSKQELKEGREFSLSDGSILKVQLTTRGLAPELSITRNGQPLPDTPTDPLFRVKLAGSILFFIGGFNLVIGLLTEVLQIRILLKLGIGVSSLLVGGIYIALGYLARKKSMFALALGIIIFASDGILSFIYLAQKTGNPPLSTIIVRVLLLIPMIRGFIAMRILRSEDAQGS